MKGWSDSEQVSRYRIAAGGWTMKDFLEFVAKNLVDHPEQVNIEMEDKDEKTVFRLTVAQGDVGKIIGRDGKTASAVRVLLRAVAAKEGKRAVLDIVG
jgi:predicted RNA-binding protein YlqC (UPF0109 family)